MKKIFLLLLLALTILAVAACAPPDNGDEGNKVMVAEAEGITINSQNPQTVKKNGTVVFDITVANDYVVRSVSAGTYDRVRGKLTVTGVTRDMRIEFELEKVDYDVTKQYTFYFSGSSQDVSSVGYITQVYAGTEITVSAKDKDRVFIGWSLGMSLADGAESVISSLREYKFMLTPDMADEDGYVMMFANYADAVRFKYDLNGGSVNTTTGNYAGNQYYTTDLSGDVLTISYKSEYSSKASSACLFWDDGTFVRDGYVLKEYNTKPDGSGEGYSLGSKFYIERTGEAPTLYCIWAKESDEDLFLTESFSYAMPNKVTTAKAPHWITSGVKITKYLGNEDTVVIPEKIGGKYVTAIAAEAFVDRDVKTLVMGKHILRIEDGAFVGCDQLTTVYYPDGIYDISDAWLDSASYTSLTVLLIQALKTST